MKKSELEVGQILFWERKEDNMCTIDKVLSIDKNGFYLEFDTYLDTDPLIVTFKTGYATCPEDIKQAILIKIGDLYDSERSSYTFTSSRDTKAFEKMLDSYKILIF